MPHEYETKPCAVPGCPGTMIYSPGVVPVGGGTSFVRDGGQPQLIEPRPGWVCDQHPEHIEWDEPPAA